MPAKSNHNLRQQVGQLMIMGFDGTVMSDAAAHHAGHAVAGRRDPVQAQYRRGGADARAVARRAEAGRDVRCFAAWTWKAERSIGFAMWSRGFRRLLDVAATGSAALFRKHGQLIGRQLRALGFNTDFAPCLDLGLEASRKALGSRTVSADPQEVDAVCAGVSGGTARGEGAGLREAFSGTGRRGSRQPSRRCRRWSGRGSRCGRRTWFPIAS